MKKRMLALLLAALMVLCAAACGSADNTPAETKGTEAAETEGAEDTQAEETEDTAAAEEGVYFEDRQHLVMAFLTFTGAPADTDKVVEKINEILIEKYNIEVEFQISDFASYKQSMTLALAGGEQYDLINAIQVGYTTLAAQDNLVDLEENDLIYKYGQGIIDAVGTEVLDMCRYGGVLYGVPALHELAQGRGCIAVRTDLLESIDWEIPTNAMQGYDEIIKITEEDLETILAQLHEKYPDMYTYGPASNDLAQQTMLDPIGGNNFGVLIGGQDDDMKVVNLFETDEYKNFVNRVYNWNQKGYINKDAATDTTSVGAQVREGTLCCYGTGGKPGSKAQESSGLVEKIGTDLTILQTRDTYMGSSTASGMPWVIPYTTANPEAAMVLMNEFYTNTEIANLLVYGIEGTHYEITEDGFLDPAKGTNPDDYATLGWLSPNQFLDVVSVGNSATLWDDIRVFNETSVKSKAAGFSFDTTSVETQIAACTSVYGEYQTYLEFGFLEPESTLKEMNEKLYAAGLQDIIDEKQKQLDAFMANK